MADEALTTFVTERKVGDQVVIRIPVHMIRHSLEPLDLALQLSALGNNAPLLSLIGNSAQVCTEPVMGLLFHTMR